MLKRLALIFALVIGLFSVDDSWAFPFGEGVFGYSILGDSDNDLVPDSVDQFPDDSSETKDSDSDGIGDNKDLDDDNDGVEDINDGFPFIPLGGLSDADADGFPDECDDDCIATGMFSDFDDDNDGIEDQVDQFPFDPTESQDTDGDGFGDNSDAFPNLSSEWSDSDDDGIGDNADNCLLVANSDQINTDGDSQGNECDSDDDNDGVSDIDEIQDGTDPLDPSSCGSCGAVLDVDLDGEVGALTDGLLIIRYMFGFTGETLVDGAMGSDAERTPSEIEEYLGSLTDR